MLRLAHSLLRTATFVSPLRIGLVGWEESGTDRSILHWVRDYLGSTEERSYSSYDQESKWGTATNYDLDISDRWGDAEKDVINLNEGRDFILERETYDIVILCWIFGRALPVALGAYNVSKQHNPEAWRLRLASSGAKYIFVFGGETEVGGKYLGEIPGYQKKTLSSSATIYDRK